MRLWSERIPSELRKWRLVPKLVEEGVIEAELEEEDTVPDTVSDLEDGQTDSEEDWDNLNETVSWPDTEDELDWEGL